MVEYSKVYTLSKVSEKIKSHDYHIHYTKGIYLEYTSYNGVLGTFTISLGGLNRFRIKPQRVEQVLLDLMYLFEVTGYFDQLNEVQVRGVYDTQDDLVAIGTVVGNRFLMVEDLQK